MTAQHTPGPWRLHPVNDTAVIAMDGTGVAGMAGDYDDTDTWPIMEANARLIAAAPDMLAACKGLLDIIYDSQGVAGWHMNGALATWDEFEDVAALEAAISKAEGSTP